MNLISFYTNIPRFTPTKEDFDIAWDGDPIKRRGGHRPGRGMLGKTEAPIGMTRDEFEKYLQSTIDAPHIAGYGGTTAVRLWFDGEHVLWRVDSYRRLGRELFAHGYPMNGEGVYYNDMNGNRVLRPLDLRYLNPVVFRRDVLKKR